MTERTTITTTTPSASGGGPDVLFIAGWGRSGSTLLDRIVGQVPGFVSLGELRDIWQRGVVEDRLCGCGRAFSACPFWQEVGRVAFGGWSRVDLARAQALRRSVDRPWALPLLLAPRLSRRFDQRAGEYADLLETLLRAVQTVAEARVLVESSKIVTTGLLLWRAGARVRVLHLVRDGRGVMYSWRKVVERADATVAPDQMLRYGSVAGSLRYLGYNLMAEMARRAGLPYRRLRYEDLVAAPAAGLRTVTGLFGAVSDPAVEATLAAGRVRLRESHTVDGNPMRLAVGEVAISRDESWRDRMSRRDRVVVALLTWPMLRRYGYPIRGGRR